MIPDRPPGSAPRVRRPEACGPGRRWPERFEPEAERHAPGCPEHEVAAQELALGLSHAEQTPKPDLVDRPELVVSHPRARLQRRLVPALHRGDEPSRAA